MAGSGSIGTLGYGGTAQPSPSATSVKTAVEAIYQQFADGWTATGRSEPYTFDSENYSPPTSGGWLRLSVEFFATEQTNIAPVGSRRFRRRGSIFVQCFGPSNAGVALPLTLADEVIGIFEGASFSGVNAYEATTRRIGLDGRWYGILTEVAFDYDDIR